MIPAELSKAAQGIWTMLHENYPLENDHDILLRVALQQWDRLQDARKVIAEEGAILTLPNGYKQIHPAVKVEGQSFNAFIKAFAAIGLNMEPIREIGRPPAK